MSRLRMLLLVIPAALVSVLLVVPARRPRGGSRTLPQISATAG
jgi:hypothetical protein